MTGFSSGALVTYPAKVTRSLEKNRRGLGGIVPLSRPSSAERSEARTARIAPFRSFVSAWFSPAGAINKEVSVFASHRAARLTTGSIWWNYRFHFLWHADGADFNQIALQVLDFALRNDQTTH